MQSKVQAILAEEDRVQRATLCDEAYSTFEYYEQVQGSTLLEMALWKLKLKSGWSHNDTKRRQVLDRQECHCLCGSNVVIPSVVTFLGIPEATLAGNLDD